MSTQQSDAQPFVSRNEDQGFSVDTSTQIGGGGLWARITQDIRPVLISGLGVVCLLGFAVGVALSLLAATPTPVVAQGADACPLTNCDFGCTNMTDDWYMNGVSEGIWMIVHAKAVLTTGNGTGTYSSLVWRETGSPDNFPKMKVVGYWEDANSNVFTAEVRVNDDGSCNDSNDPDNRIRCHEGVVLQSDSDFLCDSYSGVWSRVSAGSQGCFSEIRYGIDFQKEFADELDVEWCFQKAVVTSLQPGNSNSLKARSNCTSLSNKSWDHEKSVIAWSCQAKEEQRPSGSVDRMDVTLNWIYR